MNEMTDQTDGTERTDRMEGLFRKWEVLDAGPDQPRVHFDAPVAVDVPVIYFDLETTGLDPVENGICGWGAFALTNPECWFHARSKCSGQEFVDMEALAVNGETTASVMPTNANRLEGGHVAGLFREWVDRVFPKARQVMLCGWNVFFDRDFLMARRPAERPRVGIARRVIDLHSLAAGLWGITTYTSRNIGLALEVPPEPEPHRPGSGMVWGWHVCRALGLTAQGLWK